MKLSPPSVIGPVSVCSKSVIVRGQLTGATVLIVRNGDSLHPIGKGLASWPYQMFSLTDLPPQGLQQGDNLTAIQQLDGDQSEESPDIVVVQRFDPASLEKVICLSHLYVCGHHLMVGGMAPGARLEVGQGGLRGAAEAVDGTAHVAITPPLHAGEQLEMRQVACGQQGPLRQSPTPDPTPNVGNRLPTPSIGPHAYACDRAVYISQVVPGADVTLYRTTTTPVTAGYDVDASWFAFGSPPLQEGEQLTANQSMPGCEAKESEHSQSVSVEPAQPVSAPHVARPLCAGSRTVVVSGLTPGRQVRILQNGSEVAVGEAYEMSCAINVPPLEPGSSITAQQERCGLWSPESDPPTPVETVPAHIAPPAIAVARLYECSVVVPIKDAYVGSWVTVFSDRLGQISATTYASTAEMSIPVQPALQPGDTIYAEQTACGRVRERSATVAVEPVPDELGYPEIVKPVVAEQSSITVRNVIPGAIVEIYRNGAFLAGVNVGKAEMAIDLASSLPGGVLRLGDRLNVRQILCNKATTLNGRLEVEVVRPLPLAPVSLTPHDRETGRRPALAWLDPAAGQLRKADSFELQITVSGNTSTPPAVTRPTFDFASDLPYAASVTWQVRGRNATGVGPWSAQASFRVEAAPPQPQTVTYTLYLKSQPSVTLSIPYIGTFPNLGYINGQLVEIKNNPPNTFAICLLLPDHSSSEGCTSNATIILAPGQATSTTDLEKLFGSSSPRLPITFVALRQAETLPAPELLPVTITYTEYT